MQIMVNTSQSRLKFNLPFAQSLGLRVPHPEYSVVSIPTYLRVKPIVLPCKVPASCIKLICVAFSVILGELTPLRSNTCSSSMAWSRGMGIWVGLAANSARVA